MVYLSIASFYYVVHFFKNYFCNNEIHVNKLIHSFIHQYDRLGTLSMTD